jgi:hypothetical protein
MQKKDFFNPNGTLAMSFSDVYLPDKHIAAGQ